MSELDAFTIEVLRSYLLSTVREMAIATTRTAYSTCFAQGEERDLWRTVEPERYSHGAYAAVDVELHAAKPEPPPSAPVTRVTTGDKYADMARENERTANGIYTVQFELVCQSGSLAKAIDEGGSKVWFVPITYRGQSCYRVFWGRFNSRESAALAVGGIPRALRGPAPSVVRVP